MFLEKEEKSKCPNLHFTYKIDFNHKSKFFCLWEPKIKRVSVWNALYNIFSSILLYALLYLLLYTLLCLTILFYTTLFSPLPTIYSLLSYCTLLYLHIYSLLPYCTLLYLLSILFYPTVLSYTYYLFSSILLYSPIPNIYLSSLWRPLRPAVNYLAELRLRP